MLPRAPLTALVTLAVLLGGCLAPGAPPAPTAREPATWHLPPCPVFGLLYSPAPEDLQRAVGPEWRVSEGTVPGRAEAYLVALHCPQAIGDEPVEDAPPALLLLAPVEPREDAYPVEASSWFVLLAFAAAEDYAVSRTLRAAGFDVETADVTARVAAAPGGFEFELSMSNGTSSLAARGAVPVPPGEDRIERTAVAAAPGAGIRPFFLGVESFRSVAAGHALVASSGDSWAARFGLPPEPTFGYVLRDMTWAHTLHVPD